MAPLELAGEALRAGEPLADALEAARARTVFTTHTPVPAGNDSYTAEQVKAATERLVGELSLPEAELLALGRTTRENQHDPCHVHAPALLLRPPANALI